MSKFLSVCNWSEALLHCLCSFHGNKMQSIICIFPEADGGLSLRGPWGRPPAGFLPFCLLYGFPGRQAQVHPQGSGEVSQGREEQGFPEADLHVGIGPQTHRELQEVMRTTCRVACTPPPRGWSGQGVHQDWGVWDQQQSAIHHGPGAALRDTGSPSRKEALGEERYATLSPWPWQQGRGVQTGLDSISSLLLTPLGASSKQT